MLDCGRLMHLPPQLAPDGFELEAQSPALGFALHHETAIPDDRAVMREAEKGECFAARLAPRFPSQSGQPPEFDQSRLALMELQFEFQQSLFGSTIVCRSR